MKKRFYEIAKRYGVKITNYETKRSDMGVQMYELAIKLPNGTEARHSDGYYVGESGAQDTVMEYFESEIKRYLALTALCGTK